MRHLIDLAHNSQVFTVYDFAALQRGASSQYRYIAK
jgi:hypothetical protein